ncbi:MAG: S8 family serine peptidase, partial [Candidatus Dojkabacteria bacterium]
MSGTSQAAPHVAALAQLVWGINPELSAAEVILKIRGLLIDMGPAGYDDENGHGWLNFRLPEITGSQPELPPLVTSTDERYDINQTVFDEQGGKLTIEGARIVGWAHKLSTELVKTQIVYTEQENPDDPDDQIFRVDTEEKVVDSPPPVELDKNRLSIAIDLSPNRESYTEELYVKITTEDNQGGTYVEY